MTKELVGKTALITGSTDGIGVETAKLFAAAGAEVLVSGRNAERGKAVAGDITEAGGAARFIEAELTDVDSLRNLAAQAGDVDVLVNNAAHGFPSMALTQDVEGFDTSFAVNVRAPYFLTAAVVLGMIARGGGGVIVNMSSMAATVGMAGTSAYAAAKAALHSLTRTWAVEFAEHGIRVNTIAAGPTRTRKVMEEMDPEMLAAMVAPVPLQRLASVREIAEAVLFLASDRSGYMTGAVVPVDGGRTAV
jgi:NAD(P)-dependent dehydrogenase (short-subunit alcohol dehydrogenase family)